MTPTVVKCSAYFYYRYVINCSTIRYGLRTPILLYIQNSNREKLGHPA